MLRLTTYVTAGPEDQQQDRGAGYEHNSEEWLINIG